MSTDSIQSVMELGEYVHAVALILYVRNSHPSENSILFNSEEIRVVDRCSNNSWRYLLSTLCRMCQLSVDVDDVNRNFEVFERVRVIPKSRSIWKCGAIRSSLGSDQRLTAFIQKFQDEARVPEEKMWDEVISKGGKNCLRISPRTKYFSRGEENDTRQYYVRNVTSTFLQMSEKE